MPITAAKKVVHVAVGVLTDRDKFFITRRLPNTHLAGKWEFPGGKVDVGESVQSALRRELHEELGVDVHDAHPLMQVRHAYPDKSVLLDVWSITAYSGVPHGREGQEARWASRTELFALDFPEADLPIQRRLWLPALYAISDCARLGRGEFFDRLTRALESGLRLVQLREPGMEKSPYLELARDVVRLCHRYGAKVMINAEPDWVEQCGADGVHLSSRLLLRIDKRPLSQSYFVAASCHNEAELARAADIGADMVVLGPVSATRTHPEAQPLGWERFAELVRGAAPVVYALGGMQGGDMKQARSVGAHGLAMIDGLWNALDVAAVVAACEGYQALASSR